MPVAFAITPGLAIYRYDPEKGVVCGGPDVRSGLRKYLRSARVDRGVTGEKRNGVIHTVMLGKGRIASMDQLYDVLRRRRMRRKYDYDHVVWTPWEPEWLELK